MAELTVSAMQAAQSACAMVAKIKVLEIQDMPHLCVLSVPAKQEITEIVNLEIALSDNTETKTVLVIQQQSPILLIVDRRCLFAFDEMRIGNATLALQVISPQTVGKKCPCCGKIVKQMEEQAALEEQAVSLLWKDCEADGGAGTGARGQGQTSS